MARPRWSTLRLTGVDTDRLPEEKRRGISIELGYAFLDDGAGARVGFVDVPGHERSAAHDARGCNGLWTARRRWWPDDGPMPQTREHLAIVTLLGIERGAVVITKCDRVGPTRLAQVDAEIDALLAGTPLAQAPRFRTAAVAGQGIDALRTWRLEEARSASSEEDPRHGFRLAVDRVFSSSGIGTVATGTVFAGSVKPGDELMIAPGQRRVRVRSLHAQSQAAQRASRGQRCALIWRALSAMT
jgi:selenocysteine-specific elongation factor